MSAAGTYRRSRNRVGRSKIVVGLVLHIVVSINTEKVLAPLCQRAIYLHMNVVGIYYGRIKCAQRFKFTFTFFDLLAENAK